MILASRMLAQKLLKARRDRYILVRHVLDRLMAELGCSIYEAAGLLRAVLADAGERAPTWFDSTGLKFNTSLEVIAKNDGEWMLEALQDPDTPYDPRLTHDELGDRYHIPSDNVDRATFMDHYTVWFPYSVGCFLVAEIEPILRNLIADAQALSETPCSSAGTTVVDADTPPIFPEEKRRKKRAHIPPEVRKGILARCKRGDAHEEIARDFGVVRETVSAIARKAKMPAVASPFPPPRQ